MLIVIFCSQRSFSCVRTRGSSLTGDTSIITPTTAASIYSRPRLETAHRTSLMSTGSSDSGTATRTSPC